MAKYLRKSRIIEAIQHDDSDESATALAAWVNAEGGIAQALFKFHNDLAPNHALVKLEHGSGQNLVTPGSWLVKMEFGVFYVVLGRDFHILFDPLEPIDSKDEPPD